MRQTFAKRSDGLGRGGPARFSLLPLSAKARFNHPPRNNRRCHILEERCRNRFKPRRATLTSSWRSRRVSAPLTLGLLLCETRGKATVEYALRDIGKPIGVSTYRVTRQLPEPLRDEVPSIEDLRHVVEKLRPEMSELQAERDSDQPSRRNPPTRSTRRK